ncbi:MAG: SDR family NAD(P)-dependent oxidoreductase [Melioribacteraceae bacterium]|nr:SDR family NAD(P)-dependent oxidoreductase [Melioribacteraceae bacterium]
MNIKSRYGNWALITGASSGIGKEFAHRFAEMNINLILIARREELLKSIKTDLEERFKVEIIIIPLNLTDHDFLKIITKRIEGKKVNILINNAGIGALGDFFKNDITQYEEIIKLNCIAPIVLIKHFADEMIKEGKGALIFVGSVVGILPSPRMSIYSASKAFLNTFGESLWNELSDSGIDVITIMPGSTDTEFQRLSKGKTLNIRRAKDVVNTTLKSLGKKPAAIDGLLNKLFFTGSRFFPRKLILKLSKNISDKINN